MKREIRNPKSHRSSEKNEKRTIEVTERYYGKVALLATWEKESTDVQAQNHSYLLELRRQIRNTKNLLLHRADPNAKV